jgi:hypothetical protein
MLHLLDPGKFKKHIELTYAAVTASKNEYNCIFFASKAGQPGLAALRYFVWVMSYYSPPEPLTPLRGLPAPDGGRAGEAGRRPTLERCALPQLGFARTVVSQLEAPSPRVSLV